MNMHTTIELLLEMVFSSLSVQNGYKEDNWGNPLCWKSASEEETRRLVEMAASLEYSVESGVLHRRLWRQNLSEWISIVRNHCQGMGDVDTAGCKKA
jgi:hypothetical protein